ncbi:hypothetical protein IWQ60_007853 [Tieghemiomyces parasiticus]|uniref:Uncharacterized protein n=1 Tax=Tieghemiomyces parasiticus TaxID=78921 RepID=A0A9W8A1L0_9FUNG|nr:hypothetical protein IWQ60_007853 [Tieghemiomyces parasiticus]
MLVYLCTIAFVVVTMIFPVGTRMTTAGSFFTYLTLLLAFLTYLALLCAWNRFVVSFYPSYFGAIFKPLSVALGGYASVVCFMGIVGAFDFPNVDVLNEFLTMVLIFTLPIIFTAKAVALTIYARRCFRSIPRDLKPRSIFLAVIKLSAVILVTQMGWLLVPLTAVLFACRTFLISPGVFLAFAVVYNLAVLFTFCVICWFLTVHDSIPSLLALLSEGIAKQRMSVYLYTPNGLATQLGESDGSQPPSSPLLSSIPWRASLRIPGLMRDGSLAGGTHGSPLSTVGPAPSAGHRSTTLSGLGTGSSADQRRTNGWDRRSLRSSALVSTHRSRHIERTVRQMSKHSMFRSVSSATRPGATSPRSPQVLPCSTPDSGISLKPDCEPNHGAATFPPRRYRIGRFRWERESERFQQLYRTMRQWGYTVSSSSGASYRDRPCGPDRGLN